MNIPDEEKTLEQIEDEMDPHIIGMNSSSMASLNSKNAVELIMQGHKSDTGILAFSPEELSKISEDEQKKFAYHSSELSRLVELAKARKKSHPDEVN